MSTRANVTIKTTKGTFLYEIPSSADEPENLKILQNWSGDMPFLQELYLSPGHVGNPSLYYDVDAIKGTITVRKAQSFWVNAPKDWKERGWTCYRKDDNPNQYGYHSYRRGKVMVTYSYPEALTEPVVPSGWLYTKDDMKELAKIFQGSNGYTHAAYLMKKEYKYDPAKIYMWLSAIEELVPVLFGPVEELPTMLNSWEPIKSIALWRIRQGERKAA
jgi:hypothetical protein